MTEKRRRWWAGTRAAADKAFDPLHDVNPDDPHITYETAEGTQMLTVCANCESLKSVLFLDGDKWYCTKCKNEGTVKPTVVSLFVPGRTE